jgi:hypothetical protein
MQRKNEKENREKKDLEKKRSEAENATFRGAAKLRTLRCSSRAKTRHEYVSTCLVSTGMVAWKLSMFIGGRGRLLEPCAGNRNLLVGIVIGGCGGVYHSRITLPCRPLSRSDLCRRTQSCSKARVNGRNELLSSIALRKLPHRGNLELLDC